MRYILLDKITLIERHTQIQGFKNISFSEDVFADHFFGYPVMPGALLIESLAQAGTALIEVSENFTKKAILIMVDKAKFRSMVRPGDRILIQMITLTRDTQAAQLDGIITVDNKVVVSAQLTFSIQDDTLFYPPKAKYLVENLYQIWLDGAQKIGF